MYKICIILKDLLLYIIKYIIMILSTSLINYQEYLNIETNYDQLFSDFLLSDMVKELYESSKGKTEFGRWVSQMKKNKNYKVNQKRLNQWVEIRREELTEKFNELSKNQGLNEIRIEKGEADRLRKKMEKMKEEYEATIENMKALNENKVKCLELTIDCLRKCNFRNLEKIKKLKQQKVETIIQETIEEDPALTEEIIIEALTEPEPEPEKVIIDSSDEEDGPALENDEIQYIQAKEEVELVYYQPEPDKKSFDIKQLRDFISSNSSKWEMRFYEDFNECEITYQEIIDSIKVQYYDEFGEPEKDGDKDTISREIGYELEKIDIIEPVKY
jgi:hypothetical protein